MPRTARLLLSFVVAAPIGLPALGASIDLSEAVDLALTEDEAYRAARTEEERSEALVRLATAALLPRLELTGNYTRYKEAVDFEFAPGERFNLRPLADWNTQATLRQPLFQGFQEWRARAASKVLLRAARSSVAGARRDVVLGVATAFTECLVTRAEREVREHALLLAREQLRVAESLAGAGETIPADVARARAQEAGARLNLVEARGREDLAFRRLARLLGVDDPTSLELAPLEPLSTPEDRRGLVEAALANRREVAAARGAMEAARIRVDFERGGWLPDLEATIQYYRQRAVFPSEDWVSGALNLTVPIYDGGATAARVAEARANATLAELDLSRTEKQIMDDVDAAWTDTLTTRAAVEASESQEEAASMAYRVTESRYREGEATSTDLLSAQDTLVAAELGRARARRLHVLSTYQLAWASGAPMLAAGTE